MPTSITDILRVLMAYIFSRLSHLLCCPFTVQCTAFGEEYIPLYTLLGTPLSRTVGTYVDHGPRSVAAQSSISDLLYELLTQRRFQVPVATPDGEFDSFGRALSITGHSSQTVQRH